MKKNICLFLLAIGMLCACAVPVSVQSTPTPTPTCAEKGVIGSDRVPNPTQGFSIHFDYYLPPCYADLPQTSYPVLYLITL